MWFFERNFLEGSSIDFTSFLSGEYFNASKGGFHSSFEKSYNFPVINGWYDACFAVQRFVGSNFNIPFKKSEKLNME